MQRVQQKDFVMYRSELLAREFLTRIPNVKLYDFDDSDTQFDFIGVLIPEKADPRPFLQFGVIVWGTDKSIESEADAMRFTNATRRRREDAEQVKVKFFLPVLVLLFSVKHEAGFYAWLTEPKLEGSEPRLSQPQTLDWNKIRHDEASLRRIAKEVTEWYEGLEKVIHSE